MGKKAAVVALALAFWGARADTQEVFRSNVDVIVLNITVIDESQKGKSKGLRFMGGLEAKDFVVYEDGVGQDISLFAQSDLPLAIALVVDTSASMGSKLKVVQEAALGFVRNLRSQDYVEILGCSRRVSLLQSFTNDKAQLEKTINGLSAQGETALYQSVYIAVDEFKKLHTASGEKIWRQAIVVLSDGEDTASLITFDDTLKAAQKANATIYTIFLKSVFASTRDYFSESGAVMREFAVETGGRAMVVLPTDDLRGLYKEVLDEIAGQYTVGYESKNKVVNGKWRVVYVQVLKPRAIVRTRKGYDGPIPPKTENPAPKN